MKDGESHSNDKLLRKREVAERFACSLKTVEREVHDGRLTCVKIRGGVRFRESEVNKIINGRNQ
jgi:excisionase family DNA binding protein